MKYTVEKSLSDFDFWCGAKDNAHKLTIEEFDQLESMLPDIFGEEAPTETAINDLFWFDFESICEWLGLDPDEVESRE